ncbi:hypothetical protein ACFE04_003177 [Oxalis oulophora]
MRNLIMSLPLRFGTLIMSYRSRYPCLLCRMLLFEVFLVTHGESELNLRQDLGVRFNDVYSSPLDRVRYMDAAFCQFLAYEGTYMLENGIVTEYSRDNSLSS